MATSENIEKALVWSNLSDTPLCFYEAHWDATLCAWNGALLTHKAGLYIVAAKWCGIHPTLTQQKAILHEIERLTRADLSLSGATYNSDNWGAIMNQIKFGIHKGKITYFNELMDKHSVSTAMSWFDHDRIQLYDTLHRYNDTAHYSASFS